jgi:phosphopentomutase
MNKRFVLLVIDGLGVGAIPDVYKTRPQDRGAHTLKHVLSGDPDRSSLIYRLLLDRYFCENKYFPVKYENWNITLGKFRLAHPGADSYLGHQEIVGSRPPVPVRQFVRNLYPSIISKFKKSGTRAVFNGKFIEVENCIAVADNLETDYGLNINVVGSTDTQNFNLIRTAGLTVRSLVLVNRVIVMGGKNLKPDKFQDCFENSTRDGYTAWGINIPKLEIYNDAYQVVHLGIEMDLRQQVTDCLGKKYIPVTLIGKAADVIKAENAEYQPMVHTGDILKQIIRDIRSQTRGLIMANIQETDLSGHAQRPDIYRIHLGLIEKSLPLILKVLNPEDILCITGDHGNDPCIGHTSHTREYTPLILFSKNLPSQNLGIRDTLADIGATIAEFFQIPQTTSGVSFLAK